MTQNTESKSSQPPVKYKRKLRNYLIDKRFQLKYTTMIMLLSVLLIAVLGYLLYLQVRATVTENAEATRALSSAAVASEDAAKVSQENSEIIIAQALDDDIFNDPEVMDKFIGDMKAPVDEVKAKAAAMSEQAQKAQVESAEYQKRAKQLPLLLALFGVTFMVFLFLISIYTTHKIAGPMYKIKKLMSEVDGDSLHVAGALRRGDEMWDLFDAFNGMIERLRKHQTVEAKHVEELLDRLDSAKNPDERDRIVKDLRTFKDSMEAALE
jgi:nitrogen fixation/metabolism regulation signal transduction histidine kinase